MAKRTYSSRYKKSKEYQQEGRRKRSKGDSDDELQLHRPLHPQASASLLKKGLRSVHSQADSEDELVANIAQRTNRFSVLDRTLDSKLKTVKPKFFSIYGSREDFEAKMRNQRAEKKNDPKPSTTHLPTPPFEVEQQQAKYSNGFFPGLNGKVVKVISNTPKPVTKPPSAPPSNPAVEATKTSMVYRDIKCAEPKPSCTPKPYETDKAPAPRRDILGDLLWEESKEADLWSTNQNSSPFLRLPGEVRNRIYEYVLGGNTINICYETYRTICVNDQPVSQAPIFKYHCIVFDRRTNPFLKNRKGKIGILHSFTLLNGVCRQLYLETSPLPYQFNTIAFDSYHVMMNFLVIERRLSRQQREAITTLVLPDHLPAPNILEFLPNLGKFYLGCSHYLDQKGWYRIVRKEGQVPEVVFHKTI